MISPTSTISLLLFLCISRTESFVSGPTQSIQRIRRHSPATLDIRSLRRTASLPAMSSRDIESNQQPKKTRDVRNDENLSLLTAAVELRRLRDVETKQLASTRNKSLPKLTLCRAAGYGDDLDAYETAFAKGHKAREALITKNMGLVHFVIKSIVGTPQNKKRSLQSLSVDDLIQEGAIGLSRAVDRWDPEIGGRFSTYAVYWIRAAVLRGIAERDDPIRVPVHVSSAVNKVTAAAKQLGLDLNTLNGEISLSSSWKEARAAKVLAETAELSESQLRHTLQVKRRRGPGGIKSFESWMQQRKDLSSDHAVASTQAVSTGSMDIEHLRTELGKFLRPKEVEALSWRYGLTSDMSEKTPGAVTQGKWGEAMSFVEVGKRMHVSAEYGRRLCHKALSKLREAHELGYLEPSRLAF